MYDQPSRIGRGAGQAGVHFHRVSRMPVQNILEHPNCHRTLSSKYILEQNDATLSSAKEDARQSALGAVGSSEVACFVLCGSSCTVVWRVCRGDKGMGVYSGHGWTCGWLGWVVLSYYVP